MLSRILAAAPAVVLTLAFSPIPAVQAAGETCHGEQATMVGAPGGSVEGTDVRDVIVSNGAEVDAGAGDDLICVTTTGYSPPILGGDGDDMIDGTARSLGAQVDGGAGADTITTGPGADRIVESADERANPAIDHISTGDGDDRIDTGWPGTTNQDVVDAGTGNDVITAEGTGWSVDGGGGADSLVTQETADGDWSVDVAAGLATRNGQESFRFADITSYLLAMGRDADSSVTFRGTDADEGFYPAGPFEGSADIDLGGGDDRAEVTAHSGGLHIDGGPGDDKFLIHPDASTIVRKDDLDADLATGSIAVDGEHGTTEQHVVGFERFHLGTFRTAIVRGSGGDDWVTVTATPCVTLRGLGGDDVLRTTDWGWHGACRVRTLGGMGDDRMFGRSTNDVLFGGPGFDRADGGSGRDRCSAEARFSCESSWRAD